MSETRRPRFLLLLHLEIEQSIYIELHSLKVDFLELNILLVTLFAKSRNWFAEQVRSPLQ